jgi:hypothetical protein
LRAGSELIEARAIVEHGQWITWCKTNIDRGMRDIQQVMKMASAPEPEKALALENKRAADGMRKTRNVTRIARAAERALLLANAPVVDAPAVEAPVEATAVAEVVDATAGPSTLQLIRETEAEDDPHVKSVALLRQALLAYADEIANAPADNYPDGHEARVRQAAISPYTREDTFSVIVVEDERIRKTLQAVAKREAREAARLAPPPDHRGAWRAGPL